MGKNTTEVTGYATSGNLVLLIWTDEVRGLTGTDTMLIEDGKVVGQTAAAFPIVAGSVAQ